MSETEQRDVLRRNGPLFLQYILSGYFGASSSEEQLDWIFLKQGGNSISLKKLGYSLGAYLGAYLGALT